MTVLQYQTCVMRRDFAAADQLMSAIPQDQRTRVARFLEKQGMHTPFLPPFSRQAAAFTVSISPFPSAI